MTQRQEEVFRGVQNAIYAYNYYNNYFTDGLQNMANAIGLLPPDVLSEQIIKDYWESVGRATVQAQIRINNDYYMLQGSDYGKEYDLDLINTTKDIIQNHPNGNLIREYVNAGREAERQERAVLAEKGSLFMLTKHISNTLNRLAKSEMHLEYPQPATIPVFTSLKINSQSEAMLARHDSSLAEVYGGFTEELKNNKREMLYMASYWPDILTLNPKLFEDSDCVCAAIRLNPAVYSYLPEELKQTEAFVDTLRDAVFCEGMLKNPGGWNANQLTSKSWSAYNCPDELLFSVEGYQKVCEYILEKQQRLNIPYKQNLAQQAFSRDMKFLGMARSKFPEKTTEFDKAEQKALAAVQQRGRVPYRETPFFHAERMPEFTVNEDTCRKFAEDAQSVLYFNKMPYYVVHMAEKLLTKLPKGELDRYINTKEFFEFLGREIQHAKYRKNAEYSYIDSALGQRDKDLYLERLAVVINKRAKTTEEYKPVLLKSVPIDPNEVAKWKEILHHINNGREQVRAEHEQTLRQKILSQELNSAAPIVFKKEGIFANFNPLQITPEQQQAIAQAQLQRANEYVVLQPLNIPQQASEPYASFREMLSDIENAKSNDEIANILSNVPDEMRENTRAMSRLAALTPYACQIATGEALQRAIGVAIQNNPHAYDLLSPDQQKDAAAAYVKSVQNRLDWDRLHDALDAFKGTDNIFIATYSVHPNILYSDLYSPEKYQEYTKCLVENDYAIVLPEEIKDNKIPLFEKESLGLGLSCYPSTPASGVVIEGGGEIISPIVTSMCTAQYLQPEKAQDYANMLTESVKSYLEEMSDYGTGYHAPYNYSPEGIRHHQEVVDYCGSHGLMTDKFKAVFSQMERDANESWCEDVLDMIKDTVKTSNIATDWGKNAFEPDTLIPQEMIRCMNSVPEEMFKQIVPLEQQQTYWQAQNTALTQVQTDLYSLVPQQAIKEVAQIIQEVSKTHPEFGIVIETIEQKSISQQTPFAFFEGKEAFDNTPRESNEQPSPNIARTPGNR